MNSAILAPMVNRFNEKTTIEVIQREGTPLARIHFFRQVRQSG
jgi:hypothetical protein